MDGVDARVSSGGGWHPHEASHVPMRVGVWRHARGGHALWRHEAGARGTPRPWTGPQGVLQLKRETEKKAHESVAQGLPPLSGGSVFALRAPETYQETSTWPRSRICSLLHPTLEMASQDTPATAPPNEVFFSASCSACLVHEMGRSPTLQGSDLPMVPQSPNAASGLPGASATAWDVARP